MLAVVFVYSPHGQPSGFKTYPVPPIPDNLKIAFVGNSLTLHPPRNEVDWSGSHGMAASSKQADYAHILIGSLGLSEKDSYIRNFYPFESDYSISKSHVRSLLAAYEKRPRVVVLQLGDNVQIEKSDPVGAFLNLYHFWKSYGQLVRTSKEYSSSVFCVSTWWRSRVKDRLIKSRCESGGGVYVYIGDIYSDPSNPDRKAVDYSNPDVDAHPKNYGMKQIATRLKDSIMSTNIRLE